MATTSDDRELLFSFHKEDSADRLRYQQEFSVAGFKALILINGGAVVGLLTYAGNAADKINATRFQWAFAGYIFGLVCAVSAYLPAYLGQALIMHNSAASALAALGFECDAKEQDKRLHRANRRIGLAIFLCLVSVLAFVGGSLAAMRGLS